MPPRPLVKSVAPRAWQRMLSGRRLDLLDPSPFDVEIEDIAHGLARVARWNGQTSGDHIFSVAQHCVLVEEIAGLVRPSLGRSSRLIVLLHDAPEYVVGDMISPFKAVMGGDYKSVETRLMEAIHLRFGLPPVPEASLLALVKRADRMAAFLEAVTLAGFTFEEATSFFESPASLFEKAGTAPDLEPWPAEIAKARFLARFAALSK